MLFSGRNATTDVAFLSYRLCVCSRDDCVVGVRGEQVCYYVFLPACVCKQAVNVAQLCAASLSLASAESEAADSGAATSKKK